MASDAELDGIWASTQRMNARISGMAVLLKRVPPCYRTAPFGA
jgi:hypothetical protein